jgi:hypothetical protein
VLWPSQAPNIAAQVPSGKIVAAGLLDVGLWQPSAATLSELESASKAAVISATRNHRRLPPWSDYTFQYQGRTR